MFKLFNKAKNEDKSIKAPVDGKCIDLSEVTDKVFAKRMMGEGVAFVFEGDTIYSPCSGTVDTIAKTSHAIAVRNKDGVEVLIHIGMNTVSLKGQGFDVLVKENQKVKLGEPLVKIDRSFIEEKSIDLTTPMIITNGDNYNLSINNISEFVTKSESEIIHYEKK
ncbi:PTS glucose transporter subunit IIA [Paenibacillus sp. NPDC056933]|uniref:PTS sugar transporter subunit IIA n=1 Tax=Paenibacillus sp. NPDC056933 TaxID=3345968 RepID=UPI00362BB5B8